MPRTLKPVDTAAALARGSTARPPLPQPWVRALPLLLGSGPSRFEATRQPSSGRPKAADLRPNPLTGTATIRYDAPASAEAAVRTMDGTRLRSHTLKVRRRGMPCTRD